MIKTVLVSSVQKPEKLSSVFAAGALRNGVCAYTALHTHARLAAGHTLLVMDGASVSTRPQIEHQLCRSKSKIISYLSFRSRSASCVSSWPVTTESRFLPRHTHHRNTPSWSSFDPVLVCAHLQWLCPGLNESFPKTINIISNVNVLSRSKHWKPSLRHHWDYFLLLFIIPDVPPVMLLCFSKLLFLPFLFVFLKVFRNLF